MKEGKKLANAYDRRKAGFPSADDAVSLMLLLLVAVVLAMLILNVEIPYCQNCYLYV